MAYYTPGTTFAEHYQIVRELGSGAEGVTYLALDTRTDIPQRDGAVALKILIREDQPIVSRFGKEAKVMQEIDSPRVPALYSFGRDAETGKLFLAQEYITGLCLQNLLDSGAPASEEQCVMYLEQLLDALEALHVRHILHRDIKPANVILSTDGLKLVDLGSSIISKLGFEITRTFTGTVGYACLDQIYGKVDKGTDLFAVGRTVIALSMGFAPTDPEIMGIPGREGTWKSFCKLSPELLTVLAKMTSELVEERFSSIDEVRLALAESQPQPDATPTSALTAVTPAALLADSATNESVELVRTLDANASQVTFLSDMLVFQRSPSPGLEWQSLVSSHGGFIKRSNAFQLAETKNQNPRSSILAYNYLNGALALLCQGESEKVAPTLNKYSRTYPRVRNKVIVGTCDKDFLLVGERQTLIKDGQWINRGGDLLNIDFKDSPVLVGQRKDRYEIFAFGPGQQLLKYRISSRRERITSELFYHRVIVTYPEKITSMRSLHLAAEGNTLVIANDFDLHLLDLSAKKVKLQRKFSGLIVGLHNIRCGRFNGFVVSVTGVGTMILDDSLVPMLCFPENKEIKKSWFQEYRNSGICYLAESSQGGTLRVYKLQATLVT